MMAWASMPRTRTRARARSNSSSLIFRCSWPHEGGELARVGVSGWGVGREDAVGGFDGCSEVEESSAEGD